MLARVFVWGAMACLATLFAVPTYYLVTGAILPEMSRVIGFFVIVPGGAVVFLCMAFLAWFISLRGR